MVRFSSVDWTGIDPEEMTYHMILAISAAAKNGFQVRDLGPNSWGFGLRGGRIVPLILDANSWVQLEPTDSAYWEIPIKEDDWLLLATDIQYSCNCSPRCPEYRLHKYGGPKRSTQTEFLQTCFVDFLDCYLLKLGTHSNDASKRGTPQLNYSISLRCPWSTYNFFG